MPPPPPPPSLQPHRVMDVGHGSSWGGSVLCALCSVPPLPTHTGAAPKGALHPQSSSPIRPEKVGSACRGGGATHCLPHSFVPPSPPPPPTLLTPPAPPVPPFIHCQICPTRRAALALGVGSKWGGGGLWGGEKSLSTEGCVVPSGCKGPGSGGGQLQQEDGGDAVGGGCRAMGRCSGVRP